MVALTINGPPLAPATATSRPLGLCVTIMGDIADSGRLPGAMKLAFEGWGVTSVFLQPGAAGRDSIEVCGLTHGQLAEPNITVSLGKHPPTI